MSNWSEKQMDDPHYADEHNFYKVEAWSRDDQNIVVMLYAGSSLDRARDIFDSEVKRRPRIRLTIRQGSRVMRKWPDENVRWPDR
jgi:hypothetical protein